MSFGYLGELFRAAKYFDSSDGDELSKTSNQKQARKTSASFRACQCRCYCTPQPACFSPRKRHQASQGASLTVVVATWPSPEDQRSWIDFARAAKRPPFVCKFSNLNTRQKGGRSEMMPDMSRWSWMWLIFSSISRWQAGLRRVGSCSVWPFCLAFCVAFRCRLSQVLERRNDHRNNVMFLTRTHDIMTIPRNGSEGTYMYTENVEACCRFLCHSLW